MKKLFLEEEPWKKVPIEIIIEEKERKKREIDESWRRQPTVEDIEKIPYWRKPEEEENRYINERYNPR